MRYKNTCLCKLGENYTSELEFYPCECASFHQSSSLCLVVSLPAPQTLSRSPGPTLYHDWWRAPPLLSLLIRSASQPVPSASGFALWNLLDLKPPNGGVPDSPSSFSCVILPWDSLSLLLEKKKKKENKHNCSNTRTRPPWPAWVTVLLVLVSLCVGWQTVGLSDPQAPLALCAPPSGPETSASPRPTLIELPATFPPS